MAHGTAQVIAGSDGDCHESGVVVEKACGLIAHNSGSCSDMVCPGGGVVMVSFPLVDGVKDEMGGHEFCARPGDGPAITAADVLREIKRLDLPSAQLSVQPPGGRTLVNFPTIFSTSADVIARSIRVAGIPVEVRISPSTYTWHWGDDSTPEPTAEPGRPYADGVPMSDFVTHEYDATGAVAPRVDVTWAAAFRVRGGAWQEVGATVTIPGAPTALEVVEAAPVLVGAD